LTGQDTTATTGAIFRPYVPRLAAEWERAAGAAAARVLDGSLLGLDITGFTALSERLGAKGKLGAEELITLISRTYSGLIDTAACFGGDILKFRGDALLLFFDGPEHELRVARAAAAMQARIDEASSTESSVGPVRLAMAAGAVSGDCHFFLIGSQHRELVVCGPAASATLGLEDAASAGEILVSARTAEALPPGLVAAERDGAFLLRRDGFDADLPPEVEGSAETGDLEQLVPPALRPPIQMDVVEAEHRHATAAFVKFTGTDRLVHDLDAATTSLSELAEVTSSLTSELGVTWLESDIDRDGGKLYLVAGAPSSPGGDEERMLRAVHGIVAAGVGPPIAVGVNRGPVFAGAIGSRERRTYAVMGDTVNLAARLAARAAKGEILATGEVLQRSRARFDAQPRQFLMKGKAKPVTGYSVGRLLEVTASTERERLGLVDRQDELPQLVAAIDAARMRQSRAVELVGEPGIGKSRLVEELQTLAVGFQQLEVRCEQYAASTPFYPLRAMLRPLVGILPVEPSEPAGQKLAAFVSSVMPDLAPWLPLIALPFDADAQPTPEVDEIDPAFRRDKLHEVMEQMLMRLLLMPTTVLVEDAHWLDDASQLLVRRLAQPGPKPWLICLTRRPGGEAIVGDGATILELQPLPEADARALALAAAGDEALSEEDIDELTARAGGNPLFVRELVASPFGDDVVPESLETLLTARIDTLSPDDRLLLRHAAVIGRTFELDLLAEILPEDDGADPERWRRLAEFIEWRDGQMLRFSHDLVRAAAYEGLSFAVRREIHGRIGAALERRAAEAEDLAPLLSLHFFEAGEFDKAWGYSVAAGNSARDKHANIDAATFYERALAAAEELTPEPIAVARVNESLGDVRELAARYDDADAAYLRAIALVPGTPRLLRKRAVVAERRGHYDDALSFLDDAYATPTLDSAERVALELQRAIVAYRQGKIEESAEWAERAARAAESLSDRTTLADAYYIRAAAEGDRGGPARDFLDRALAIFEELNLVHRQATVLNNLGVRAFYEGAWDDAAAFYGRADDAARRAGDVLTGGLATMNRGEILLDQGHRAEAAADFEGALRTFRAAKFAIGEAFAGMNLARIAALEGRFDEARAGFAESGDRFAAVGSSALSLEVDARLAEAYVLEGRHEDAAALARATLDGMTETGEIGTRTSLLHRVLGLAAVQARRPADAPAEFDESLRVARELGAQYEVARTLRARADAGLGEPEDAHEILDRLGVVSLPLVPLP
ncbi:MAG TPA: adenylate/guanylate cyclase domain-containing protein, partial [Gaiellaceae bacterium]|nr:adenylate/guanylate cyclase domain-containing protein [Gaiellaceae bacterium]